MTDDDRPGAVFLLYDTIVAKADSAQDLHEIFVDRVEGRLSEQGYEVAVKAGLRDGRFMYTGYRSRRVELTERVTGNSLLEFTVKGSDALFYAYNERFEARPVRA